MELEEIVSKLVGPIHPTFHASLDRERLANLKAACELVDSFLVEINLVSRYANSSERSVKAIGDYAMNFLKQIQATEIIQEDKQT